MTLTLEAKEVFPQSKALANIVPLEACLTEVYSRVSNDANEIAFTYEKLRSTSENQLFFSKLTS